VKTKNPQAFRPADLSTDRLAALAANDLGQRASATTEDDRHTLVREDRLRRVDELSVVLALLLRGCSVND